MMAAGRFFISNIVRLVVLLCALLVFTGCTQTTRFDDFWGGFDFGSQREDDQAPRSIVDGRVLIRKGDTLYELANELKVPVRALIDANGLAPPYDIYAGHTLIVPQSRTHTVITGDTLYSISQFYDVNVSAIAELSGLKPPYHIQRGQVLKIPSKSAGTSDYAYDKSGEIPTPKLRPDAGALQKIVKTNLPEPPERTGSGFRWPLDGKILSRFGSQQNGMHNDGINIAAAYGTPVHAAEAGVVAYAGDELEGFGNLILIQHADNWVTAYGHTSSMLVERGIKVERGKMIARVGNSGAVSEPQLHFEIRRKSKALDPLRYLP